MDPWIEAVTTVGFPIVAFFAMFWLVVNTIDKNTQAIKTLSDCLHYMNKGED